MKRRKLERKSNIELFRIFLMLLVISHHYVVNSGITNCYNFNAISLHMIFYQIVGLGGKIGINCFLIITGYYMCKGKAKKEKWFNLLLEIMFYKLFFNIIFLITGYINFSIKDFVYGIPILMFIRTGNDSFTALYMILFLLIPYINILIKKINKSEYQRLLLILLFFYSLISTFINDNFEGLGWYTTVYLIGAYIRLHLSNRLNNLKVGVISSFICLSLSIISIIIIDFIFSKYGYTNYYNFVIGGNKILAISTAISLFILFINIKLNYNKIINVIASTTFGVFLIHTNSNAMRKFLWQDLLNVSSYYSKSFLLSFGHWFLSIIIIYVICVIIDLVRKKFVEIF